MTNSNKALAHLYLSIFVTLLGAQPAWSYSIESHETYSGLAYDSATIPFVEWGITDPLTKFPYTRGDSFRARVLVTSGARDEDDLPRPRHHFFDPEVDIPLTLAGVSLGEKSIDWAVDGKGQGSPSFSFAGARKALFEAFTLPSESDRLARFGLVFESLGHVAHHIQDMAQPQHVRNEAHLDLGLSQDLDPELPFEQKSRYERWASRLLEFGDYENVNLAVSRAGWSTPPHGPRDYWKNGNETGIAQFTNSNFVSNRRNFIVLGGMLAPQPPYHSPVPTGITTYAADVVLLERSPGGLSKCPNLDDPSCSMTGTIDFVSNDVMDSFKGSIEENFRAASYSIFNQDLQRLGVTVNNGDSGVYFIPSTQAIFTTNTFTFPLAANWLVPRSVGYSGGLINYFFRGRIDLIPDPCDETKLNFVNNGDEALTGDIRLYYDSVNGTRSQASTNSAWSVANLQPLVGPPAPVFCPRSSIPINVAVFPLFDAPTSPLPKKEGVYMMVFSGTQGGESPITNSVSDSPGSVMGKLVTLPLPEFYWGQAQQVSTGQFLFASFMLPPRLDAYFQQNFDNAKPLGPRLRINGVDYVRNDNPTAPCGAPGNQLVGRTTGGLLDPSNGSSYWSTGYFQGNQVMYHDEGSGGDQYGPAESFRSFWAQTWNNSPFCSNYIEISMPPGPGPVEVEYFLPSQSNGQTIDKLIFSFSADIELLCPDLTFGFLQYRLVMSDIKGARVLDNAVRLRASSTPSTTKECTWPSPP